MVSSANESGEELAAVADMLRLPDNAIPLYSISTLVYLDPSGERGFAYGVRGDARADEFLGLLAVTHRVILEQMR